MNRKKKILRHINKNGDGIEIGPCDKPIASKKEGFKVQYIDHMSRDQLIAKYTGHNVNLENIEEVDYIWRGEKYSDLTGKNKHYDWIIASHLIEHTPDLIGFFLDCDAILKDDGVISLVVPDKRYCFDHYRPTTGISKIIDNHFLKSEIHSPGAVAEHHLNAVSNAGIIAWDASAKGEYNFVHSMEYARQCMNSVINENKSWDVHAWCFVPHSFRLIVHDLFRLGLIPFREIEFFKTEGCEFYITLGKRGRGINTSRLEMLEIIESELREETDIREQHTVPLYRLHNPNDGRHHWTVDSNERSALIGDGWIDEGIACYVFARGNGRMPLGNYIPKWRLIVRKWQSLTGKLIKKMKLI